MRRLRIPGCLTPGRLPCVGRSPGVPTVPGLLVVLLAPAALALSAFGQAPAQASVDVSQVGIEDELILTVSVPEERGGAPSVPSTSGFEVLGSQRVSKTSIVNGRMTRTVEWVYRLRPLAVGELIIPEIPVPGYAPAPPIRVRVEAGSLRPVPSRRPFGSPFSSPFGSLFDPFDRRRTPAPAAPEVSERDLFIRAEAEDVAVHVGEQVLVLYRLYSRLPVLVAAPVEAAQPEGFWTEEVELPDVPWQERGLDGAEIRARRARPGPRRERRTVDGTAYDTYPLLLRAVFPTGAGERELPGPRFEIALRGEQASFFGPQRVVLARAAPAVTIRAAPLPEAGRPARFDGAVGEYELRSAVLREEAPLGDRLAAAGEPLVFRVELRGSGNLRAAGTPSLPESAELRRSFRFFDPDTEIETGLTAEGESFAFGGQRIWEFPIVPEAGGVRRIGAVTLDVFNPRTASYERLASDAIQVRVEGPAGALPAGAGPAVVERLGDDIRYLKPAAGNAAPRSGPWRPGAFFVLSLTLPALWNFGVFLALRRRDYRAAHAAAFRRRDAARDARRALARVAGGGTEAAAAVGEALACYAAARLGVSSRGLTPEGAESRFVGAGADPDTARRFRELLSRSEAARFASGRAAGETPPARREAEELVRVLDDELGRAGNPS